MKFVCVGYGDEDGYHRLSQDERDAAHAQDAVLRDRGAIMGIAGEPMQVRNHDGNLSVQQGSFLRSDLPIAGFSLIEAEDRDEAVQLLAGTPCAVAYGVIEVWPLVEPGA